MNDARSNARARLHAFVSGRVQGVGYRWFVQRHAGGRRLTGWVRNLEDGRVELEAEGPRPMLDELLEALGRGPRNSRVDHIAETWGEARNTEEDFTIR